MFENTNQKTKISYVSVGIISGLLFLCLPSVMQAGKLTSPPNNLGLVGYWSMNDNGDSTATDFSGNSNDGTLKNMNASTDWINGRLNSALDFDGTDDYVDVGDKSSLNLGGDNFTISTWVKMDTEEHMKLVSAWDGINNNFEYLLEVKNNHVRLATNNGSTFSIIEGTTTLESGTWYHLTATYDGTDGRVYVNGNLDNTDSAVQVTDEGASLYIGAGSDQEVDGQMDEVRIYNRALSSSEITDLYNTGFAKVNDSPELEGISGLAGWWPFDGGEISGSTAEDASGNSNDGTINGASTTIGRVGQALDFDSSNSDYVEISSDSALRQETFTVSTWIKAKPTGNTKLRTIQERTDPDLDGTHRNWVLWIDEGGEFFSDDAIVFRAGDGDGGNTSDSPFTLEATDQSYVDNKWHYVVGTVNDSKEAKLYVDGDLKASTTFSDDIWTGSAPLRVGRGNIGNSRFFNNKIDDPRVYDRALTSDEIQRLYNATRPDDVNTSQNNRLTSGLVGQWSFDGKNLDWTATNEVRDTSGNDNHGNANFGKSQTAIGQIGQALDFDGSDDYVDVGDNSSLNLEGDNFTLSAWVKMDTVRKSNLISAWVSGASDLEYLFRINNGHITLDTDGSTYSKVEGTTTLQSETWYHLIATYDGTDGKVYVNGSLDNTGSVGGVTEEGAPLYIGAGNNNSSTEKELDGQLDEVRIYDRALTSNEIQRLYNMGRKQ